MKFELKNRSFGVKLGIIFSIFTLIGAIGIFILILQNQEWYWTITFLFLTLIVLGWFLIMIKRIRTYRCDLIINIDNENINFIRLPVICIGLGSLPTTILKRNEIKNFIVEKKIMRNGSGPTRVYYNLVVILNNKEELILSQCSEEDDLYNLANNLNNEIIII
jgi:hypothetical protein